LDGLIGGNISLAKSYIADITTEKERSVKMGIIGASFGIGFIIGPAIGGTIVKYNSRYPSLLATILSGLNFIGMFFIKESISPDKLSKPTMYTLFGNVYNDLKNCLKKLEISISISGALLVFNCFYSI